SVCALPAAQYSVSLKAITARQLQALVRRRALPKYPSAPRAQRRAGPARLGKLLLDSPGLEGCARRARHMADVGVVGRGEAMLARAFGARRPAQSPYNRSSCERKVVERERAA